MDHFRVDRYHRLDSSDDIALQRRDDSIELEHFDSRRDRKSSTFDSTFENDSFGPELEPQRSKSSLLSSISNRFRSARPELEDEQLQVLQIDKDRRNVKGWRMGVVVSACAAGLVFLVNFFFFVIAMATVGQTNGIGTLYEGDCNTVKRADAVIHLFLNILGVVILAASNYTTQCLSSPTRKEIDKAHRQRRALDIGLPSAFNLFFLSWPKAVLWSSLMLSTLPLHLLWNSSIFSTVQTNQYSVVVGTTDFLNNGTTPCTSNSNALLPTTYESQEAGETAVSCAILEFIRNGYSAGNYTEMSPVECITAYANTFMVGRRNIIAIMNTSSTDSNYYLWPATTFTALQSVPDQWPLGIFTRPDYLYNSTAVGGSTLLSMFNPFITEEFISSYVGLSSGIYPAYQWLCNYYTINGSCTTQKVTDFGGAWEITPAMYPIETCYSEVVPPLCKLEYAGLLVGIVLICNAIKTVCMTITAWKLWRLDNPIIVTVGDAVATFLERPDETTKGYCLMDRKSVRVWKNNRLVRKLYKPPKVLRFFQAVSIIRWASTLVLCLTFIAVASYLCNEAASQLQGDGFSGNDIWGGFGTLNPNAILDLTSGISNAVIITNVLVANSPQLILSISYFMYNAIYTAQLSAYEWSKYAAYKKPLRVTFPRGNQASTYWLQLPYWYSLPLSGALALLHYLISQSIFLANIEYYSPQGIFETSAYQPALGFSPIAILASILVGTCVVLVLVINSFRKLNPNMPLMGNNSAIISAACHPDSSEPERELLPFKSIRWGATSPAPPGGFPGHCSFTAKDVELPVRGQFYE